MGMGSRLVRLRSTGPRVPSTPHLHAAEEGMDGSLLLRGAAPHLLHHGLQQLDGLPGGCLQGLHGLGTGRPQPGGGARPRPRRPALPRSPAPPAPAARSPARRLTRGPRSAPGSPCGERAREPRSGPPSSPLTSHSLYPPLHVPEAADAQQRLLVGGEHDVGLGVQRCGGSSGEGSGQARPRPAPAIPATGPDPRAPARRAALTALLEHVAAALAQGHDVVAREHARPVRFIAAASAQRLPTRVAEVRGLCILRREDQRSLSPPTCWGA